MSTIQERLRTQLDISTTVFDPYGNALRPEYCGTCKEAANVIDGLVEALEIVTGRRETGYENECLIAVAMGIALSTEDIDRIDAALASTKCEDKS